ncbi:MAG: glycosyltransferase family 39 protein [Patescibacteria group bacterium]
MKKFVFTHPLWLILLFALALRLPLLSGSFWLDEAAQAIESSRTFSQQLDIVPDFQPPLLHYIVHFAQYFSQGEWWLRLWGALLPGLVTIWASYHVARKLFSDKVALWTALLLASSSFHIFYSQELRPYSLPAMWGLLATLVLVTKPFKTWQFVLLSVAGLYSSYLYPFLLFAQLVILWQQHSWQKTLHSSFIIGLAVAPWLPMFLQQLQAGQNLRTELPGWETVVSIPQLKALALVPLKFIFGVLNLELTWPFLLSLLLITFLCAKLFWVSAKLLWKNLIKNLDQFPKLFSKMTPTLQLLVLLILPLLTAWLISFAVPVVRPKRLLFLLPFFLMLAASWLKTQKQTVLATYLLLTLIFINLWGIVSYWHDASLQRENWRALKHEITTTFPRAETLVIMSFDEPFAPWRWYEPDYPTLVTGKRHISDVENLTQTLKPAFDKKYVLVFDYLRTLTDPEDKILTTLTDFGFVGRGVIDYPGIGFVRIYTRSNYALGLSTF